MKRSFLLILLFFCVVLTGCQAGKDHAGSYYAVVTNAPTVTQTVVSAMSETQLPTQMPTDVPIQAPSEPPNNHLNTVAASNTGKTTVTINAEIPVIGARPWMVYFCRPRMMTEQELLNMAAACFGNVPYSGDQSYRVKYRGIDKNSTFEHTNYFMDFSANETVSNKNVTGTQPTASMYSSQLLLPGNIVMDSWAEYNQAQQVGHNYYWPISSDYPVDESKITDISMEDAQKLAENAVAAFAPDYVLAAVGITCGEQITAGDPATIPAGRWGYLFTFMPAIDGRLTTYVYGGLENVEFMTPCAPDYIRVAVDGGGVQAVRWSGPTEITGEKGAYELLPWQQIEKIALELLPLKFTSWERSYSKVSVTVDEIRLGYMRVLSRNQADVYELIPVWDFVGRVYMDNTATGRHVEHSWAQNSLLTINAIDGTVIDRTYGY
ncbi:MAG: hypothetical protein IKK75_13775 [Clostridia bacterium]|nr:hypothetical protein [Clostridia bacterium]